MVITILFWLIAIVTGLAATAAMTAFSYFMSYVSGKKIFVIPVLAKVSTHFLKKPLRKSPYKIARIVHYSVGVVFSIIFEIIILQNSKFVNFKTGLLFGIICGTLAVFCWRTILLRVQNAVPSGADRNLFLLTIWIGHLIFSETFILLHFF